MSKTEAPADGAPAPKKKGKLKPLLLFGVGGALLLGGGVGAGLYAAGAGGGGAHAEEKDVPKLVPKGEGEHKAESGEGGGGHESGGEGGEATAGAHGAPLTDAHPDPSKYEATYFAMEQPFTSNLQDSDGLIQVSLGVSTYYDGRVIDNLKRHEMPVRSAILMVLADQDPNVIGTPPGKKALQTALTKSINDVLRQKEGFGGIDDVYFSSFIVQ
ncbi:flagellar basal body-associated FliL family protein [Sphingomonas jatrophae]|uniref:Flagellar protein FliL n=1 Tax=Sphingomonas jatrophae TaxID=1166337 RepID=A0A1I6MB59_9SPHN|nr:flagellar basal body-associated FliL family protein [Sphingomonas jatrophae]SFS12935.1 flagellar FliL protein [Sphingomonas jatrophae]